MSTYRRATLGSLATLVLVAAWLVAAPAAAGGGGCHIGYDLPPHQDEATTEVKLAMCAFSPTVARIPVGGTVTFVNGEYVHLITGANQTWGERDVEVRPRTKVSYTFDTAGVFPYACTLHPGMSGAIVVGDVDAGEAAAIAPAASVTEPSAPGGSGPEAMALGVAAAGGLLLGAGAVLFVTKARRRPVEIEPVGQGSPEPAPR